VDLPWGELIDSMADVMVEEVLPTPQCRHGRIETTHHLGAGDTLGDASSGRSGA
jgi:hypothetical protein